VEGGEVAQPRVSDTGRWSRPGLAVLIYGFRPFFLLGALTAALAVPVWIAMLEYGFEPAGPFSAVRWHAHEMIFGYLAAIMAGFALTAVPNWTGRLPLSGLPLAGLAGLWVMGRIATAFVASPVWALGLDGAFLVVLAAAIWREVIIGANRRNLPIALMFTLMAIANLAFHADEAWPIPGGGGHGQRLALGVAASLMALIGGRIVPSFTRNWMARMSLAPLPAAFGAFDKVALVATVAAMAGWIVMPEHRASGVALLVAAGLSLARLWRWHGPSTWREPIVAILHLGFLWLALSLGLMGLAILRPDAVPDTAALHALTAGAIGTMTLAVMTRASLGHTGRAIVAGPATLAIYALVTAGALVRVGAPFLDVDDHAAIGFGGLVWSAAFGLFVLAYGPLLLRPGEGRL
jgi:uncharacterized protein involved in response to NO